MARTNAVMSRTVTGEGKAALMVWKAVDGSREVQCDLSKMSPGTLDAALIHGFSAKIGDAAAKSDATVAEKFDAMESVINNLYADKWRGDREPGYTDLVDAICESNPTKNREKVFIAVKAATDAERKALRAHAPIKKILDRRAAEAAKKSGVDVSKMLAGFGD